MSEYIVEVRGQMPDAVYENQREEIVRCRDCKYYGEYNGSWCRRTYEPVPSGTHDYQTVEPDGFCAWGERK